jgi:ubiquinone/menaquinone biosynthesis C-methylase UbiE
MSSVSEREAEFFNKFWQQTKIEKIRDSLQIPEVNNLRGTRILICSCGSGREPVLAANAGAEVFAFDISSQAIKMALAMAEINNVHISAEVMNFHSLKYPDNFFDFMYGDSILHHVDCKEAGREIFRCLKSNGIAYFWENSDRNPILRYLRRIMFGSPGGYQRQRFLFFKRHGTTDEYPLTEEEVKVLSDIFSGNLKRIYTHFTFFQLLSIFGWQNRILKKLLKNIDNFTAKLFPSVVHYSFVQGICLQKKVM